MKKLSVEVRIKNIKYNLIKIHESLYNLTFNKTSKETKTPRDNSSQTLQTSP